MEEGYQSNNVLEFTSIVHDYVILRLFFGKLEEVTSDMTIILQSNNGGTIFRNANHLDC